MQRFGARKGRAVLAGVAIAASLAAVASSCEWPEGTRYVKRVFSDVESTTGITYRTTTDYEGNPVTLKLDIYQPAGDTAAKRPAIMWQFGGGWVTGARSMMTGYAQDAAKRGYVGVSIDYRIRKSLSGSGGLVSAANDAYDDSVAALQWLQDHAAEYRIDPNAIIAGGYSAGAINSMNDVFYPGTRGPATTPAAGGVAIAGFTIPAPTAGDPPILMFQGDADTIVQPQLARNTCNATKDVGNACDFINYAGGDHFIFFSKTEDILNRTADWVFERVLLKKGYKPETVG